MRAFVREWSPLIAALLVVLSIVYNGISIRTHTGGVQERLATLEKNIESIHNIIAGEQGLVVLLKSLDERVNERLQNLVVQQDKSLERHEQDVLNTQNALQVLKSNVDAILSVTQRMEYIEEILLDVQGRIEEIRRQQNRANR